MTHLDPRFPRALTARVALLASIAATILAVSPPARSAPKTTGPGSCITGNCHVAPRQWWQADDHFYTQRKFFEDPRSQQYLSSLGIGVSDFAAVNKRCMTCHATVVGGREGAPPEDGVGCENCHGPGSDYMKIHQENAAASFPLGLVELKKQTVRAGVCVGCHYVQDSTLVNAGHPLGWYAAGTEYTSGVKQKISRHWKTHQIVPADVDNQLFMDAIVAKGPAPTPRAVNAAAGASGAVVFRNVPVYIEKQMSPLFFPSGPPAFVELDPFPALSDSTGTEEIVSVLRRRVDYLYRTLRAVSPAEGP